jgi:hypothetical protein
MISETQAKPKRARCGEAYCQAHNCPTRSYTGRGTSQENRKRKRGTKANKRLQCVLKHLLAAHALGLLRRWRAHRMRRCAYVCSYRRGRDDAARDPYGTGSSFDLVILTAILTSSSHAGMQPISFLRLRWRHTPFRRGSNSC